MRLMLLILLLGCAGCNSSDLVSTPAASPGATPVPTITVIPTPPPCDPSHVGPAPNVTTTSPFWPWEVNADYYQVIYDNDDGDDNAYRFVWSCTADPHDPNPPHKVVESWDLSADDGDANNEFDGPHFYACCFTVP